MNKQTEPLHCQFCGCKETEFPVLDGLLTHYLERGARIVRQNCQWHLFRVDGEGLACGNTISAMLRDLILREA